MRAGTLAQGRPHYVDPASSIEEAIALMQQHQIRRVPVIDDHVLVGIVAEADIARSLAPSDTGETVEQITL